jgi:hypothetical protein
MSEKAPRSPASSNSQFDSLRIAEAARARGSSVTIVNARDGQEPTRGDPLHVDGTPTPKVLTDESGRQPPQP